MIKTFAGYDFDCDKHFRCIDCMFEEVIWSFVRVSVCVCAVNKCANRTTDLKFNLKKQFKCLTLDISFWFLAILCCDRMVDYVKRNGYFIIKAK